MSLGQVRVRPKANKPSITNMSAVDGGLFGREPGGYGQVQQQQGGGGGPDFLMRLEQAEGRDTERQRNRATKKQQAYGKRSQDGGFTDTGWAFGDDSTPGGGAANNMYKTSNGATNEHMQQAHEAAVQRHHEGTIRTLLLEQGLSEQEAQREIAIWRRDVQSGRAAPIPEAEDQQAPKMAARRGVRGENGNFLSQTPFEDPFKKHAGRAATPPKPKPWEIDDAFKRRAHGASPPQAKAKAWEVNDPFKQRTGALPPTTPAYDLHDPFKQRADAPYVDDMWERAAAGGAATAPGSPADYNFGGRDPNASSIAGGIFG